MRAALGLSIFLSIPINASPCVQMEVLTPQPVQSGQMVEILVNPAEGLEMYRIEAISDAGPGRRQWGGLYGLSDPTTVNIGAPHTSRNLTFKVRVTATDDSSCVSEQEIQVAANLELRDATARLIIPVAGKLTGAFDSQFVTSLSLISRSAETSRGTIVFRPAGATDSSVASMDYEIRPQHVLEFDDVVGEMGAAGLGSLEIVPHDPGRETGEPASIIFPDVQARIVSLDNEGTYGGSLDAVSPLEYLSADPLDTVSNGYGDTLVIPQSGDLRVNFGVRTLGFTTFMGRTVDGVDTPWNPTLQLALLRSGESVEEVSFEFALNYSEQRNISDWFTSQVLPGDHVQVHAIGAIPYWTLTDNHTNDPSVYISVPPAHERTPVPTIF